MQNRNFFYLKNCQYENLYFFLQMATLITNKNKKKTIKQTKREKIIIDYEIICNFSATDLKISCNRDIMNPWRIKISMNNSCCKTYIYVYIKWGILSSVCEWDKKVNRVVMREWTNNEKKRDSKRERERETGRPRESRRWMKRAFDPIQRGREKCKSARSIR